MDDRRSLLLEEVVEAPFAWDQRGRSVLLAQHVSKPSNPRSLRRRLPPGSDIHTPHPPITYPPLSGWTPRLLTCHFGSKFAYSFSIFLSISNFISFIILIFYLQMFS